MHSIVFFKSTLATYTNIANNMYIDTNEKYLLMHITKRWKRSARNTNPHTFFRSDELEEDATLIHAE